MLFLPAFFLLLFTPALHGQENKNEKKDYLLLITDTTDNRFGYISQQGDTVIALGKYDICFTDTFRTYAIVHKTTGGFYAIDRQENTLYEVFKFDNGPDYVEDGLFRIIENGKIGYADAATGKVVIKPQYECAFPFENGIAKVSVKCKQTPEGEHTKWESEKWDYINKKGKLMKAPN